MKELTDAELMDKHICSIKENTKSIIRLITRMLENIDPENRIPLDAMCSVDALPLRKQVERVKIDLELNFASGMAASSQKDQVEALRRFSHCLNTAADIIDIESSIIREWERVKNETL